MEIKSTVLKRCVLVTIEGRIDSATAPQLQEALNELIDEGNFKLVLDLNQVDFISSAGLWVLVNAQKKCKRFNRGELVLACIPQRIMDALDLAGFIPYFKTYKDTARAVGSF
jgi:anti-sigma B factor antagonist